MKKIKILTLLLLATTINAFAQNDLWQKAVSAWESSKNLKPHYCIHAIDAGAKGYASDYNKAAAQLEGDMLYNQDGTYNINIKKIINKGEVTETDGNPTKEKYKDLMHTKENLIFAKENQKHITILPLKNANGDIVKGQFKVDAKIPNYEVFKATAYLNPETGMPEKVVNIVTAKSKTTKGSKELIVLYKIENNKLVADQYITKAKIAFFGNAVFQFDAFVFSKNE